MMKEMTKMIEEMKFISKLECRKMLILNVKYSFTLYYQMLMCFICYIPNF